MAAVIALLYLLPALALIVLMALRRYPGERVLARLRRSGHRARARTVPPLPSRGPRRLMPRGGLLMAFSLAVRPPPAPRLSLR